MKDVAPYIQHLGSYPLPLSAAYPLFSWRILFREGKFVGIMHADDDFPVLPGDSIVVRKPEMTDIMEAIKSINHQNSNINNEVILFDLNTDNIKRFKSEDYEKIFIIGVMAAAFSTHANACVAEYSDHNYYMFSVFNRDQTSPAYLYDIASYWQKYAGNTSSINLSFYRWNKEDIKKVAQSKKDAGMLSYLRNLNAYLDACEKLNPNAWNYASKQERLQIQQSLTRLNNASKIYKGTQLKSQYALLRMRTNMMKGFHQQNITYWNAIASRFPKSPWREAMRNIYARALWKTGKHHQALEIYAEQGDMASIRVLARNYRNLAGIQSIYLKNPNSAMLTYLVQDFVNNCQQTIDSRSKEQLDKEWIEEIGAKVIYQKEALNFITFANKVIAEGKTQSPCLWRSATAMLHYLYGYQQEAWKEISEAVALDGTQRMKDNARAIRLLVSTRNTQVDSDYPQYLVGEFKWLNEMAKEENPRKDSSTNPDNHYVEVKERVAYRALYNRFKTMADKAKRKTGRKLAGITKAWPRRCMA